LCLESQLISNARCSFWYLVGHARSPHAIQARTLHPARRRRTKLNLNEIT
jgi:hypothetical protein